MVLASLLVACGALRAWRVAHHAPGIDFYQYWVVGKVVGRGEVPSIYEHGSRAAIGQEFLRRALAEGSGRQRAAARFREVLEPMSTPFLFTALSPFALGGYDACLDAFLALSLASLLASVFVLGRVVELARLERLILLALLVSAFQPVTSDLRVGNVGQVQLGLVALYAWLSAGPAAVRQVAAGAVLGAATAFKPNLVAVAPLLLTSWALDRQWRRLTVQGGGLLAGTMAAMLVSAAFFGSFRAWVEWLTAVRTGGLPAMPIEAGNVSLLALMERWLGIQLGPWPGVAAVLAVVTALMMRRRIARPAAAEVVVDDLPVAAAACLVFLISSPLVWLHYLILALPAVMLLLRAQPLRQWLAIAALTALAIDPYVELLGLSNARVQALVVLGGLVTLFALVLAEIAAPAQNHAGRHVEM